MRHHSAAATAAPPPPNTTFTALPRSDWATIRTLAAYVWPHRWRALLALALLLMAKGANVAVPFVLKHIVDALDLKPGDAAAVLVVPVALLLAYGLLRVAMTLFTELREIVFYRVSARVARTVTLSAFNHLLALSLRFHLERQTGGVTRDLERGSRAIHGLLNYMIYNIVPTLVEIALVITILLLKYDAWFAGIALSALVLYIGFTVSVTEWRTKFRRQMNEQDARANTKAIDALLNYETVKYFGNEAYESRRYDSNLQQLESTSVTSQKSLSLLNLGQSLIIAVAVTLLVWRATEGVVNGTMSLGDLVLVNAFMIQLYMPLNFLGVVYREIKQSLIDMERMFALLRENREVADAPDAAPLHTAGATVQFDDVHFAYDARRPILKGVSLEIAAGTTLAVVGASGAGKSTLSRLLFRFYDAQRGTISIDGKPLASLTQASVRATIGIVPQDTVLFNDTIYYNIAYGRPEATRDDVIAAAKAAHIHDFITSTPDGYDTVVGERGLKLSGGEKQRVAIARCVLKNPAILVFDEATSALDTKTEQAIQAELREIAQGRTTLIIAHRLSTIAHAHQILVLEHGRIIERGTHAALLTAGGRYAQMWAVQSQDRATA
jgi:ATP-binding cassette, subfamily B, heavy metal transporter